MILHKHIARPHKVFNPNMLHEAEKAGAGLNQQIALALTKTVGTMLCAYGFLCLALLGLPNLFPAVVAQWVQWTSQTLIQLVMLSVIMVGQGLLGRKQEIQSEEQFKATLNSYHDIEQIMQHLEAQDAELLRQSQMLMQLVSRCVPSNPQPPALQEKLARLGYGAWYPTPGVLDEDTELYLSLDANTHLYVMPVEEALELTDGDLGRSLEILLASDELKQEAAAEYERRRVKA